VETVIEEGWRLLKDKCAHMVENAIARFGLQHGVCRDALSSHVQVFLYNRLYEGDGQFPYCSSAEDVASDDDEEGKDENDDEVLEDKEESEDEEESDNDMDGDSDSGEEGGEGEGSDEDGVTVDRGGKGVPLYRRKSRILLGDK